MKPTDYGKYAAGALSADYLSKLFATEREPRVAGYWTPDPLSWLAAWDVNLRPGRKVHLYKVTNEFYMSGLEVNKPTQWLVGSTVTCDDWSPAPVCGFGLHLGPTVEMAARYQPTGDKRFLLVETDALDLVPIPHSVFGDQRSGTWSRRGVDKCKVRSAKVLAEVDIDGTILNEAVNDAVE